jgi:PleD family two-component response regulator
MEKAPIKILLADDDRDDRYFFELSLSKLPIKTSLTMFSNGVELMNQLLNINYSPPDIIFLDLNMPLKSGFECLSEIMALDRFKSLPIIIYSTSMDQKVVDSLFEKGAFHFIRKPGEYSKLKELIFAGIKNLIQRPQRSSKEDFVINHV